MDLTNPKWIYLKAVLFVLIGCGCFAILLMENFSIRIAVLLAVMIWAFSRAYYFAFYVIEKYVDKDYRFSGLISFASYVLRRRE
ncbi:MAG: hypothetical protein IT364_23925 [Candidatus Hydrogenedentes bacterium]|nr:hypothetical protein [Candidatus Hydrogenedentota bacterium]